MKPYYKQAFAQQFAMGCPTAQDIQPDVIFDCPTKAQKRNTMIKTAQITDSYGTALSAAAVQNLSNGKGVISDTNGVFRIEAAANDIIRISYLGLKTVQYQAQRLPEKIVLQDDVQQLSEVVVTASKNNQIQNSKDWLTIALMILSIAVTGYYGHKMLQAQKKKSTPKNKKENG